MVYYYDSVYGITVLNDIYGNVICRDLNIGFYPFQMEHKFRYSGLLYDKLKHLLNYIYRNVHHNSKSGLGSSINGDYLYYSKFRFFNTEMYPVFYTEHTTNVYTVDYLPESVAQTLYFMHP